MGGGQCPEPSTSWRRNGLPIIQDGRISISPRGDYLAIRIVRREDAGIYQCFVSCMDDTAQAAGLLTLGGKPNRI